MEIITEETVRQNIIRICKGEVGTCEFPAGSNRQKYGAWFGANGQFWCCFFVSWVFDSVGHRLLVTGHKKGFGHTRDIIAYAKKHNLITKTPKPGDLVLLDFNGKFDIVEHIGIFAGFQPDGRSIFCYEGNTRADAGQGQDNGDTVAYKKRDEKYIYCFVDVSKFLLS